MWVVKQNSSFVTGIDYEIDNDAVGVEILQDDIFAVFNFWKKSENLILRCLL